MVTIVRGFAIQTGIQLPTNINFQTHKPDSLTTTVEIFNHGSCVLAVLSHSDPRSSSS